MSIFPAVGTVYPSLLAFKLDSFERGLQHSLHLTTRSASPGLHQHTYCAIKVGLATPFCDFKVVAKNVKGTVKVTTVNENHTCDASARVAQEEEARRIMTAKVEKLRQELQKVGDKLPANRPKKRKRNDEDSSSDFDYDEEEDEEGEEGEEELEEIPEIDNTDNGSQKPNEAATSIAKTSKILTPEESKKRALSLFPPAQNLRKEIANLISKGPVSLPSTTQEYDTARELLVVLHAYSQQHDFSIYRKLPHQQIKSVWMVCTRRKGPYSSGPGGSCKFEMRLQSDETGKWNFVGAKGVHNHPVARKHAILSQQVAQPQSLSSSYLRSSQHSQLVPQLSTLTPSSHPYTCFPQSQNFADGSYSLYAPTVLSASSPAQDPPVNHHPALVSFLRSFNSAPLTLDHTLSTLYLAGIDSLQTLVSILSMDRGNLERFAGSMGGDVGEKLKIMAKALRDEVVRKI